MKCYHNALKIFFEWKYLWACFFFKITQKYVGDLFCFHYGEQRWQKVANNYNNDYGWIICDCNTCNKWVIINILWHHKHKICNKITAKLQIIATKEKYSLFHFKPEIWFFILDIYINVQFWIPKRSFGFRCCEKYF